MAEDKAGSDHGSRMARVGAVSGSDEELKIKSLAASWLPTAKEDTAFTITAPKLKPNPAISSEEERVSVVKEALTVSIKHMHDAEQKKTPSVIGMKTYALAIITEVFNYKSEQIVSDEGALADLSGYLTEMIRVSKGVDVLSSKFNPEDQEDPDVELYVKINRTWDLPSNEFGQPAMYQRVNWRDRDLAKGN